MSSSPEVIKTEYEIVFNYYDFVTHINISKYVEETPSLEFKLMSAKLFSNASYPRTNFPFCNPELPLSPEMNMCIHKHTGLILVDLFENDRLNCGNNSFVVAVSSLQFPFRKITVSLNLKCIDSCAPIGEHVMQMIRGGCHKNIKSLSFTQKSTLSSSGRNISKILGFQFDTFHTTAAVGLMINVEDLKSNRTYTKNITIDYQEPHAANKFFFPFKTLDLNNFELTFQFTEILENKSLGDSYDCLLYTSPSPRDS